jgi:pyruvate/2-oxoglutarate dehydrogenase complex dihydrolipoamide acyltransferase (E2) component
MAQRAHAQARLKLGRLEEKVEEDDDVSSAAQMDVLLQAVVVAKRGLAVADATLPVAISTGDPVAVAEVKAAVAEAKAAVAKQEAAVAEAKAAVATEAWKAATAGGGSGETTVELKRVMDAAIETFASARASHNTYIKAHEAAVEAYSKLIRSGTGEFL